jgi:NADH-quinone oxidoreductase subunit E
MEKINMRTIKRIVSKYQGDYENPILPVLQEIQGKYNYLPRKALEMVSELLGVSRSTIYGIVTFYAQFSMEKRGRYLVRLCNGTACHVKGSIRIKQILKQEFGLEEGKTTSDNKFTLQEVACLGSCFLSPVMMINSNYFGNLTPEKARIILKGLK